MNLTIFAGFLLLALRLLGDHPKLERTILAAVVGLYLVVVPAQAPIVRAAVMILVFLAAESGGRRYDRVNTLAWAAVITLLWRPLDLWSPGFQLSYLGVGALLTLAQPLRHKLFGVRLHRDDFPGGVLGVLLRARELVKDAFSVSLCAWGVCTPLILHHTGIFSPLGAFATVVVMPLVSIITGAGYLALLAGIAVPELSLVTGPALAALSRALAWIVTTLDHTPWTVWYAPKIPFAWAAVSTAAVVWWMIPGREPAQGRTPRVLRWACSAACAAWLAWLVVIAPSRAAGVPLRIDALAVRSGGCTLIRSGDDAVLYDCGSSWTGVGQRAIPRALRDLGVHRVRRVIISRPETDAFSGLIDVLSPLGVREVLVGEQFVRRAQDTPDGAAAWLLHQLELRAVRITVCSAGDEWDFGGATLRVAGPARGALFQSHLDASLAVTVAISTAAGRRAALLTGEARQEGLRHLSQSAQELRAHAWFASPRSSAWRAVRELAKLVQPDTVIVPDTPGDAADGVLDSRGAPSRVIDLSERGRTTVMFKPDGAVELLTAR